MFAHTSVLDWIVVALGLTPLLLTAVMLLTSTDVPPIRVFSPGPWVLPAVGAAAVVLAIRLVTVGALGFVVFPAALLAVVLLVLLPALAIYRHRTREARREFDEAVKRGEASRPAYNLLTGRVRFGEPEGTDARR